MLKVLFNDAPWLRGRVRPEALRYVHPSLDLQTCRSLEISNVSDVVEEQLEEGFQPEYCNEQYADEPDRFSVAEFDMYICLIRLPVLFYHICSNICFIL